LPEERKTWGNWSKEISLGQSLEEKNKGFPFSARIEKIVGWEKGGRNKKTKRPRGLAKWRVPLTREGKGGAGGISIESNKKPGGDRLSGEGPKTLLPRRGRKEES